ncbi:MAG: hypothetical protein HKO57_01170, partial [Akkermansiaceae bacterium]|nr:hypothetical protein [Akkermansiaceae bacterium]
MRRSFKAGIKKLLGIAPSVAATVPEIPVFAIAMYTGPSPTELRPRAADGGPVFARENLGSVRGDFVADPFLIRTNEEWFMFYEVHNQETSQGEIGLATSPDGGRWEDRGIVLSEPFHLSYPYVFEWTGGHYMIPECFETGSVRLYRADAFPGRWVLEKVLLEGRGYVDPSIFHFEDNWWLFVGHGRPDFRADTLRLFMADSPLGPWAEHPMSPVVADDNRTARPAGRVVVAGGRPVRFAQDCSEVYGGAVRAFEITTLTADTYEER